MEYAGDKGVFSNGLVVADFYANWCGPCKKLKPHFAGLAEDFPKAVFVKVDTDAWEAETRRYEIASLPTVLVLYNGREEARIEGLDVEGLRAAVASAAAEHA